MGVGRASKHHGDLHAGQPDSLRQTEFILCNNIANLYEHNAGWVTALGVEEGVTSEFCGTAAFWVQVHNQFFMAAEWSMQGHRRMSTASCPGPGITFHLLGDQRVGGQQGSAEL